MKIKIIVQLLIAVLFTGMFSMAIHAAQQQGTVTTDQQLKVMGKLIDELQREIAALKTHEHAHAHKIIFTTSPYIGLNSAYDASDLTANFSTMNEDLFLLRQRKQMEQTMHAEGKLFSDRSVIEIGGGLEGQLLSVFRSKAHSSTDLDLTRADINILAQISEWAIGVMTIAYDNSALLPTPGGIAIANSRFFLPRGFLTLGNLTQSPLYASFGQMYVPFGRYASNLLSPPLTLKLGRTTGRALLFGFDHRGINGSIYAFRGNAHPVNTGGNQWGVNIGYHYEYCDYKAKLGAGYIANIADSNGMRSSWLAFTGGFATVDSLAQRIPGMDFHGEFSKGPYDLFAEYIGATATFAPNDLSFNGQGAKPQAMHLELAYHPKTVKPSTLGAGYDQSWQIFNIPQKSLFALYTTSLWKNTIETVEYRRDISNKLSGSGRENSNTVVAQVGFYF